MIKGEKLKELIDAINEVQFEGFDHYRIGDALYYALYYYDKKSFIYEVKAVFAPILKGCYKCDRMGSSGMAFLFSSAYADRQDHRNKFDKVTSLEPESTVISFHKSICIRNVVYLLKIPRLFQQTKTINADIDPQLRRFIAYWIYNFICERSEIKKILFSCKRKTTAFVSYCDVMPVDSAIIQYCNKKRITTMTLQHGQFNTSVENGKAAFEKSFSKFFLCFGPHTAATCQALDINKKKLIPLGQPEMINESLPKSLRKEKRKAFGVVLSFFELKEENIQLIHFADLISREFELDGIIRPHPSLDMRDYKQFLKKEILKIQENGESMESFIKSVDFAIAGSTSVFQNFVVNLVPIFRLVIDDVYDLFRGIDWCKFSDIQTLKRLVKEMYTEPERIEGRLLQTRAALIGEGNVADNYKMFFDSVIRNAL